MSAVLRHCSTPLRLADHVRACTVDDQVVLLDLRRSRYLGLSRRQWQIVDAAIGTGENDAGANEPDGASARALVQPLVRQRILTAAPAGNASGPLHQLPTPTASIDVRKSASGSSLRLRDLCRFAHAALLAMLWLRFRSLHAITRLLEARHHACHRSDADRAARLAHAVAVFERLRPLAFTSKDQCLFDSLALTIFLAGQGIAAHWVIGVAARPFEAHSWVQDGSEVLNDLHENVGRFTPLLVV